jgi:hypothetical protein
MKKLIFILIVSLYAFSLLSQPAGVFPRILGRPKSGDHLESKVKDLYTSNCGYAGNCNYLYPVFVENFDDNLDLANKWDFGNNFGTDANNWYGDGYYYATDNTIPFPYTGPITNHNIKLNSGIATLVTIPENITRNSVNYKFTSGYLKSLFRFRTGVFEARIKAPSNNKMWPAYWLIYSRATYAEIDIFEFYDPSVSSDPCDLYALHKMTLLGGPATSPTADRGDKYPLPNPDVFHDYKLVWNEYEVFIFIDGIFVGYGTKYFKGLTGPFLPCLYSSHTNYFDPSLNLNCAQIQAMPDNLLPTIPYIDWGPRPWYVPNWVSWPPPQPPQPYLANKVDRDIYFPANENAMHLIVNNGVNKAYRDDDFTGQSKTMDMQVDWIKVSQPFCCGVDKTVCSLTDLGTQTFSTGILTGRNITIGNAAQTCTFVQLYPGLATAWYDRPVMFLATDMIAINAEAHFEGGTYAEMRITDCGSNQRMDAPESEQVTQFLQEKQNELDSITRAQAADGDVIAKAEYESTMQKYKDLYYNIDIESVSVGPVPTDSYLEITCSVELFGRITSLTFIDASGKEIAVPVQQRINIENFASGFYNLKIKFDDGTTVIKKVVKS